MDEFTVVGWQYGQFEIKDGKNAGLMQPYASVYVTRSFPGECNADYQFYGYKAEKFRVNDAELVKVLEVGQAVNLFFDSTGKKVIYINSAH